MTSDSTNNHDIKLHLRKIETRLDQLSLSPQLSFDSTSRRGDEIDLREIWNILWKGKWWIVGITALFAVGTVMFALSLPNKYKAEAVLAAAQEKSGGLNGLAAQYGGLAAMAGINLGRSESSDIDQAIALVKSWPFLDAFVEKYDLKPLVMAVKKWDRLSDEIIFNPDIYDAKRRLWIRESKPNRPSEPTSYEVYRALSDMISISQDTKTGLVRLSVEHSVPDIARSWTEILTREVNRYFQERDVADAARNIEYLRAKISETSIAEMQLVFYRMVESQMKTLMLAEVSDEYLLKTVIKPVVPEIKSKPKRSLICILGVILGGMLSIVFVFIRHAIAKNHCFNFSD